MKLCLAEKPSVAKEIARIIGANTKKDGYFEGNGYQVSWTFGHLCTLKTPDDYSSEWKRWDLRYLPMIPQRFGIKLINNPGIEKQFNTIKTLVKSSDEVINCGDAGIEGELIQRWVLLKAKCKAPLKRLWISSLTEEAIKEGFENLKNGSEYDKLYAAGNARAIGDWLLGMNATRLYTVKYGKGRAVLSIGRVQTPTLALIVNRYNEIKSFVSEPYWELKTIYREVIFSSTQGRFSNKEEAQKICDEIKNRDFEIISSTKKKGKESPPKLFDLTSLQVECNKKYDFSADETLKLIQTLYERKLVTYPRVDTTFLPTDMYPKIENTLKDLKPYANYTEKILASKIPKSKKVFDNDKITDHHAIIPTGVHPENLNQEQKKVYDAITRRFIAAFYPDCIVSNTVVLGETAGYEFKATGRTILEQGWRELYPQKSISKDLDEAQEMPAFEKNERGSHQPDLQEKETSPPKLYTEATLLRAMETAGKIVDDEDLRDAMKDNGIGRPSTRANIIETLFKRNYVVRERKNLVPTPTGIDLIDIISNDLLKSVELTGMWEKKLRMIEKGEYETESFMDEMKLLVSELVADVKQEKNREISIQEEAVPKDQSPKSDKKANAGRVDEIICPKCKKHSLIKGKTAIGCSGYKEGCTFKISFEQFGKKINQKQIEMLIQKGISNVLKDFTVEGKKTQGKLILNRNYAIELEQTKETTAKHNTLQQNEFTCPLCGKGTILKGKTAYGCSQFRDGCKFLIPFKTLEEGFQTTELTEQILEELYHK
jgi:DNA topoisomerase III